jgi:glycosyltransferase involved in cell wall biosynthesis
VFPEEANPPIGVRPAWLARAMAAYRLRRARRVLVARGCRRIVLSIRRPELVHALDTVPHDLSCYHVDDEYSFSPTEQPISPAEVELLSRVDRVFMLSEAMVERKGHLNPTTLQIPHGVDHAAYSRPCPEPDDLRSIPRPRIGYTGFVKHQLDWDLVEELARRHPTWSFVFVGALSPQPGLAERIAAVARLENVRFLGSKDAGEIARYPQHFDVAIMPYRDDAYTRYIRPAKVPEYLAAGTPCVGTRIRPLEDFADVVRLATGPDEWSRRIAEALAEEPSDGELAERRRALALRFDWSHVVPTLAASIAEGLGESLDP